MNVAKTCATCKAQKPVEAFGVCLRLKDGRNSNCKVCRAKWLAEKKAANPEMDTVRYAKERERRLAYAARQREALGPDAIREANRAYYVKNRCEVLLQVKVYHAEKAELKKAAYRANPNEQRRKARAWIKANPARVNARTAARRAMRLTATPAWANQFFIEEAYHLAKLRSEMTGFVWHVDHLVPLKSDRVCGLHVEHNLAVIPGSVNCGKRNWHWPDMP